MNEQKNNKEMTEEKKQVMASQEIKQENAPDTSPQTTEQAPNNGGENIQEQTVTPPEEMNKQQEEVLNEILTEVLEEYTKDFKELLTSIRTLKEAYWLLHKLNERPLRLKTREYIKQLRKKKEELYTEKSRELSEKIENAIASSNEMERKKWVEEKENLDRIASNFTVLYKKLEDRLEVYIKELAENTRRKKELLSQFHALVVENSYLSRETVFKVKSILREWKKIGHVLPKDYRDIRMAYDTYLETFNEKQKRFREAQKEGQERNYETKKNLLEELKALQQDSQGLVRWKDWLPFRAQFFNIKDLWEQTGAVPRNKEEIEKEYRKVKKEILAFEQKLIEKKREDMQANLRKMQNIIKELEEIIQTDIQDAQQFKTLRRKVRDMERSAQRTLMLPREHQAEIKQKISELIGEFYKKTDKFSEELADERRKRAEKKKELLETLKQIINNQTLSMKEKNEKIYQLKQEWWNKTGPNNFSEAYELYNEFKSLVQKFQEEYAEYKKQLATEYPKNLKKKNELVARLEEAYNTIEDKDELKKAIDETLAEWKKIGEVPREEKPKLHDRLFRILKYIYYNRLFADKTRKIRGKAINDEANLEIFRIRLDLMTASASPLDRLYREQRRLTQRRNDLIEDIRKIDRTFNMFTIQDESGIFSNQMNRKKEALEKRKKIIEAELNLVRQKIRELRSENPPEKEE